MKKTVKNVQKLINQGKSVREIAEIYGITYTPMRLWMKKNGLSTNYAANKKNWTNEDLINAIKTSLTKSDVLRKLGLKIKAGNYDTINKYIKTLGIDTTHMTGKSHGKTKKEKKPLEEVMIKNSTYSRACLKKRLIKEGILKNKCSECGLENNWNGKPITMVLDHINGKNDDNRLENLRLLCPNCNSQTDTFCKGSGASQVIASV